MYTVRAFLPEEKGKLELCCIKSLWILLPCILRREKEEPGGVI